jgi:hypothetical protein
LISVKDRTLAIALEKAGYSILKMECVVEKIYDTSNAKSVPSPVVCLKVIPSNGAKALFIDSTD